MSLSALRLPGIQDHRDDWKAISDTLPEVKMYTLPDDVDPKGMTSNEWMDEMIRKEQSLLAAGNHDILIAHSYGTHRAVQHLLAGANVSGVILLNPPNNSMKSPINEWQAQGSLVERVLAPLTQDLNHSDLTLMHQRHEKIFNKKLMGKLLGFLRNGVPFKELLDAYSGTTPVLIIESENDPWKIDGLTESESVRIHTLKELNHYPHLSDPERVATKIRDWLQEINVLQTEFHEERTQAPKILVS